MIKHLSLYTALPYCFIVVVFLGFTNTTSAQELTVQQKDSIYLASTWKDFWKKFNVAHSFVQITAQHSIETIDTKQYTSPFMYSSNYDEAFPIGFKIGASWDILYNKKTAWRTSTYMSYLSSKTKQLKGHSFPPLIGDYYTYPFKNSCWYLGFQLLYKQSLWSGNNSGLSVDWLLGPGIDIQISPQNMDQQQYKQANYYLMTGNTGFELSNKKANRIGVYYQYGYNAPNSLIKTTLSAWQLSLFIPLQHQ